MSAAASPAVYEAINKVTKVIGKDGISKDKQNQQQGYKFRGIDDVYNALNAALAGAGLCVLPRMMSRTVEERTTQKGGVLFYVTVDAEYDFVAVSDGSKHTVKVFGEAMDSADKATNKAMSAAYKYCCMQTFCIPTEGMIDDADAHTPEPAPKKDKHTPAQQDVIAQQLRASIDDAMGKIEAEYQKLGQMATYISTLGAHGYERAADIPADYEKAKPVIDELKSTLKDLRKK